MKQTHSRIQGVPAVLYGGPARRGWLFLHGKGGSKEEGEALARLVCPRGWQVLALDLPEHGERKGEEATLDPWHVLPELQAVYQEASRLWQQTALEAVSLGAWFALLAYGGQALEKALLVSPVVDMERLICQMMAWAGVTETQLEKEGQIPTAFGETLSWEYWQYAKSHPIVQWQTPTALLYGGRDTLVERQTVETFAGRFGSRLDVWEEGEHWFHTPEQLAFLEKWTLGHI